MEKLKESGVVTNFDQTKTAISGDDTAEPTDVRRSDEEFHMRVSNICKMPKKSKKEREDRDRAIASMFVDFPHRTDKKGNIPELENIDEQSLESAFEREVDDFLLGDEEEIAIEKRGIEEVELNPVQVAARMKEEKAIQEQKMHSIVKNHPTKKAMFWYKPGRIEEAKVADSLVPTRRYKSFDVLGVSTDPALDRIKKPQENLKPMNLEQPSASFNPAKPKDVMVFEFKNSSDESVNNETLGALYKNSHFRPKDVSINGSIETAHGDQKTNEDFWGRVHNKLRADDDEEEDSSSLSRTGVRYNFKITKVDSMTPINKTK